MLLYLLLSFFLSLSFYVPVPAFIYKMIKTVTKTKQNKVKVLKLNAQPEKKEKRIVKKVTWTEDTIDNEHLGRAKSNSMIISMLYLSRAKSRRPRKRG